jgi:hypothetical protein
VLIDTGELYCPEQSATKILQDYVNVEREREEPHA